MDAECAGRVNSGVRWLRLTGGTTVNKSYIVKVILSIIALSLWIASLIVPVWEESGAGRGHLHSGGWVLFWTFTWGLIFVIGIPWAILNIGLFVLLFVNLKGRRYEWLSVSFLILCAVVTLLTGVLAFYGVLWRYGMWLWIGSMYFMGFASYIEYGKSVPRRRYPRGRLTTH